MKNSLTTTLLIAIAAINASCGGGSSQAELPTTTPTSPSPIQTTPAFGHAEGDSYTYVVYENAKKEGDQFFRSDYRIETMTVGKFQGDRSYYTTTLSETTSVLHYDNTNSLTSARSDGLECVSTDWKIDPAFNFTVGYQWNATGQRECISTGGSRFTKMELQGSATNLETIDTFLGKAALVKVVRDMKFESRETPQATLYRSQIHSDCWYDEKTGFHFRCYDFSPPTNNVAYGRIIEIIGLDVQNHPLRKLVTERFSGHWRLSLDGSSDYCDIYIQVTGDIYGKCQSRDDMFEIKGRVSEDGEVKAQTGYTRDGLQQVRGTLNTLKGQGTLGENRKWTADHKKT